MSTLPMNGGIINYETEAARLKRQRVIADRLRQQAETPTQLRTFSGGSTPLFGSTVERIQTPNKYEPLLRGLVGALSGYQSSQLDKQEAEMAKAQMDEYRDAISRFPKTTGMREATRVIPGETTVAPDAPVTQQPTSPYGTAEAGQVMPKTMLPQAMAQTVTAPDRTETYQEKYKLTEDEYNQAQSDFAAGLNPSNPMMAGIRDKMMLNAIDAPEKMYAREDAQMARESDLKLKAIEAAQLDAQRRGDRAEAARLQREFLAEQNRQSMEFKVAAHNDILGLRRDIANQSSADRRYGIDERNAEKATAANAKTEAAAQKTQESKDAARALLNEMDVNVDVLNEGGGVGNSKKGTIANAGAWVANTGLGQTMGKIGATKNQRARNNISNIATNLLLELKNAKGLSASQMNSNMELQTYLKAIAGGSDYDYDSLKDVTKRARDILKVGDGGGSPTAPKTMNWGDLK